MLELPLDIIAALTVLIWLYLLAGRGAFWLCRQRDDFVPPAPKQWPSVAVIVPARNEAEGVADTIASLMGQDYPGTLRVILVDDASTDDTAAVAERAAREAGGHHHFQVVKGQPLPTGWTGKLWAVKQGIDKALGGREDQDGIGAGTDGEAPDYVLFTDADIVHEPDSVRWLAAQARANNLVLTSLMA